MAEDIAITYDGFYIEESGDFFFLIYGKYDINNFFISFKSALFCLVQ